MYEHMCNLEEDLRRCGDLRRPVGPTNDSWPINDGFSAMAWNASDYIFSS